MSIKAIITITLFICNATIYYFAHDADQNRQLLASDPEKGYGSIPSPKASDPFDENIWNEVIQFTKMKDAVNLRRGGNKKVNQVFKSRFIENVFAAQERFQQMIIRRSRYPSDYAWLIRNRLKEIPFTVSPANEGIVSMTSVFSEDTIDKMNKNWKHRIIQKVLINNPGSDQEEITFYFGTVTRSKHYVIEFSNDQCRLLTGDRGTEEFELTPNEDAASDDILDLFVDVLLKDEALFNGQTVKVVQTYIDPRPKSRRVVCRHAQGYVLIFCYVVVLCLLLWCMKKLLA